MYLPYPVKVKVHSGTWVSCVYTKKMLFTLLNNKGDSTLSHPNPCKEYILDHIHSTIHKVPTVYVPKSDACLDETRIVLHKAEDDIDKSMDLLNKVEDHLKIPKSICFKANNSFFVVRGSPRWLIAPPMLSFYTLILRAGKFHDKTKSLEDIFSLPIGANIDYTVWAGSKPAITAIMKHGDQAIFGLDMKSNWFTNPFPDPHQRGIYTMGTGSLKSVKPNWYEKL